MKKILLALLILIALVGGGIYYLTGSLDSIVKAAVEQVGSEATGTTVTLSEVEISPTDGHGALRGFVMTNPKGFAEGDAFKFDEVSLTIDVSTLLSDPVVIKEIVIAKPEITYAIGKSSSNVEEIQKNVDGYAVSEDSGNGGGEESDGPKMVIENLYMRGGTVKVSAPGITDETLSAPLPEVHLTAIGEDGRGSTPAEVARQAIEAIAVSVKAAVKTVDLDALFKDAGALAGQAKEQLEKATEEAGEGLKKLLE